MNRLSRLVAAGFLLLASSNGNATVLDIDFNGTQLLLGTFESAQTGTEFYNYDTDFTTSAGPRYPGTSDFIPLQNDALQIFAHIDTTTDRLSFGVILEKPLGSGGGSFNADVAISAPAQLAFVDDPPIYDPNTSPVGTTGNIVIDLDWSDCCTDGFVISDFDPEDLFIDLTNITGSDLTQVIFLSPDRNNTVFDFPTDVFNISIRPCDPDTDPNGCVIPSVPVPAAFWLFASVLAGWLGFGRKLNSQPTRS